MELSPPGPSNSYLDYRTTVNTLRLVTGGAENAGKSTLISRLLLETQSLFDARLKAFPFETTKHGTLGEDIDQSLLLDGPSEEREQGIIAHRCFSTLRRNFIVLDFPGHIQYTKHLISAASDVSLAIILVDARSGIVEQTRRHTHICYLMGIRHIILVVNKIELIGYKQSTYEKMLAEYRDTTRELNFSEITPIPISARVGDNIVRRSRNTPWHSGPPLITLLEASPTGPNQPREGFALAVQLVNKPNSDFCGYSGVVLGAPVCEGAKVCISPGGAQTSIKHIWLAGKALGKATPGLSVTLELEDAVDCSRGDIITALNHPAQVADQFEADIIWMTDAEGLAGHRYLMKIANQRVAANFMQIKSKLDINTQSRLASSTLQLNDIARVTLNTSRPITFEKHNLTAELGSFVLINPKTNRTIAAGIIRFALRRANNVHRQYIDIDKASRRELNGHSSRVFWFTGLSGAGKSTIANAFSSALHNRGIRTYVLDGDNVRLGLNKNLGFTETDRTENIRRIAEVSKLMVDAGIVVICALISPYQADREMARSLFEKNEFVEIFVDTPIELCEARDKKGLYKKARSGELPNFTGINSPYERPSSPDFLITADQNLEDTIKGLIKAFGNQL